MPEGKLFAACVDTGGSDGRALIITGIFMALESGCIMMTNPSARGLSTVFL